MTGVGHVLAPGPMFGFGAGRPLNLYQRNKLTPAEYRTFQAAAPRDTHYRAVSCAEFGCLAWAHGWEVHVDPLTPEQRTAVETSGRRYRVEDRGPGQTVWIFEAGQVCFQAADHALPNGRQALFVVRNGDHRWSEVVRQHRNPEDWRDDCAEHQQRIASAIERG